MTDCLSHKRARATSWQCKRWAETILHTPRDQYTAHAILFRVAPRERPSPTFGRMRVQHFSARTATLNSSSLNAFASTAACGCVSPHLSSSFEEVLLAQCWQYLKPLSLSLRCAATTLGHVGESWNAPRFLVA